MGFNRQKPSRLLAAKTAVYLILRIRIGSEVYIIIIYKLTSAQFYIENHNKN